MLFTESQLAPNGMGILDEATYLTEEESLHHVQTIPIRESQSLDCNLVAYSDIEALCEDYGVDYEGAIDLLSEANDIPSCLIAVVVPEEVLIETPELADAIPQVVVTPLSSNDLIGSFVEAVVDQALETGNDEILDEAADVLLNEGIVGKVGNAFLAGGAGALGGGMLKMYNVEKEMERAGGSKGIRVGQFRVADQFERRGQALDMAFGGQVAMGIGAGLKAVDKLGDKIPQWYQAYKDKPRTVIAKAIAKLRGLYSKLQAQANKQVEKGKAGIYHKVMAKITNVVDKLLRAMQRAAN